MQYGGELLTYKRIKKSENGKEVMDRSWRIRFIIYFVVGILISRVVLANETAPFGIAFMLHVIAHKEDNLPVVGGCGALIGYITLYNHIDTLPLYIVIIGSLVLSTLFLSEVRRKKRNIILFFIIYIEYLIYNYFINGYTGGVVFLSSSFDVLCIVPLYFIVNYAFCCIKELKTKHLFCNEEIISMAIVVALIISGTWGVSVFGISIRNILTLIFVLILGYVNGSSTGASAGVAIGTIVGMSSNNIIESISVYGFCGLIAGLFKDTGKIFTVAASMVAFLVLKIYSNMGEEFKLIEVILGCLVMLSIPNKFYRTISLELNWEKKQEKINDNYIDKTRSIFSERLMDFSETLYSISSAVSRLINNEKLLIKGKSSALVENLADRVCSNCDMNSMCWKREIHYTYSAFEELIQNYQEHRNNMPSEIDRKCIKRTALINNTEQIVNNYIIGEMWKDKLSQGREILAGQINNMAKSILDVMNEFNENVKINNEIDRNIRKLFNKYKIKYSDVFCYDDRNGRLKIKVYFDKCLENQFCRKQILPIVNEATFINMTISQSECVMSNKNKGCSIIFEEQPKLTVASHVGRLCKNGEKYNGDSYSFNKLNDGTYMMIISDGMGSGPEAGQESRVAVELMEKFAEVGFNKNTSINMLNSIMTLKFSEDEKFSTLDMANIDTYTGDIEFMKVGAVASYIKKGNMVEKINSNTLPIGVLDKVDAEVVQKRVSSGDIVVMMSDGVIDCNGDIDAGGDWIEHYLSETEEKSPRGIAEDIMKLAKIFCKGKPKDDMTVLVSKVYRADKI